MTIDEAITTLREAVERVKTAHEAYNSAVAVAEAAEAELKRCEAATIMEPDTVAGKNETERRSRLLILMGEVYDEEQAMVRAAAKAKREAEADLEYARDLRSIAKRQVDALIAQGRAE